MPKPFRKLRRAMYGTDPPTLQSDLAIELRCSLDHVNRLLNKKANWTMSEMYTTLEIVGISCDQLHEYFPKEDLPNEEEEK